MTINLCEIIVNVYTNIFFSTKKFFINFFSVPNRTLPLNYSKEGASR